MGRSTREKNSPCYCRKCGQRMSSDDNFCFRCGAEMGFGDDSRNTWQSRETDWWEEREIHQPRRRRKKLLWAVIAAAAAMFVLICGIALVVGMLAEDSKSERVSYTLPEDWGQTPTSAAPAATVPAVTTAPDREFDYLDGTYKGPEDQGLPEGRGTLTWEEGRFVGDFVNGFPQGEGTFYYSDGSSVDGTGWSYGSVDYLYPAGRLGRDYGGSYSGMLLNGQPAGYGKLSVNYAGTFRGSFRDGHPQGKGTYSYHDSRPDVSGNWSWLTSQKDSWIPDKAGSTMYYTGMSLGGEYCGYGILEFDQCGTFYGEFENGEPSGKGAYVYLEPVPETSPVMIADNWTIGHGEYALEHYYYGLKIGHTWQGFGIGVKKSGYHYAGEIRDNFRSGYGRVFSSANTLDHHGIHKNGKLTTRYPLP